MFCVTSDDLSLLYQCVNTSILYTCVKHFLVNATPHYQDIGRGERGGQVTERTKITFSPSIPFTITFINIMPVPKWLDLSTRIVKCHQNILCGQTNESDF